MKEVILEVLKKYYPYGDDYSCGENNHYYWAQYFNDYPMQHGYGIEVRLYKATYKFRSYKEGYRYRLPEEKLNEILQEVLGEIKYN